MQEKLDIDITPVATAREAVTGADIVMCATNSMEPVFAREWLEPGMHVSSLKRLELDATVVAAADVVFVHVRDADAKIVSDICLLCTIHSARDGFFNVFWVSKLLYIHINAFDLRLLEHG